MKVFDTVAADDIAERVVEAAIAIDGTLLEDDAEAFMITPGELRLAVVRALEDYNDAQPDAPAPDPTVSHKRHVHKRAEIGGVALCESCGVAM